MFHILAYAYWLGLVHLWWLTRHAYQEEFTVEQV